ncbi:uncharacterized protein AMSG_11703, partial [Thecamonas trahens ATCC 50062]
MVFANTSMKGDYVRRVSRFVTSQSPTFGDIDLGASEYFRPSEYRFFEVHVVLGPQLAALCGREEMRAMAKIYDMEKEREAATVHDRCEPGASGWGKYIPYVAAVTKVEEQCGLDQLTPRSFVGPFVDVNGTAWGCVSFVEKMPGEVASLDVLMRSSKVQETGFLFSLVSHVKDWQLRLMMLRDVLLSFRDRHPGNVFIHPRTLDLYNLDGFQLTLKQSFFRPQTIDSSFLPMSEKHAIASFGWIFRKGGKPDKGVHEIRGLDYRCWIAPPEVIAAGAPDDYADFPPTMQSCLHRIAGLETPQAVQNEFGFAGVAEAGMLLDNAKSLLEHGLAGHVYATAVAEQDRIFSRAYGSNYLEQFDKAGSLAAALTPSGVTDHVIWYLPREPCCAREPHDRHACVPSPLPAVAEPDGHGWDWLAMYGSPEDAFILYNGGAHEYGPVSHM